MEMSREAINRKVVELIRSRYSVDDELCLLRTGPSDEAEVYNAFVEECCAWGRGEKAQLDMRR
jgi:hypothetical protein